MRPTMSEAIDERSKPIVTPETPVLGGLAPLASDGMPVCCALPIALMIPGFDATVAAPANAFPLLISLRDYKGWGFCVSAVLMLVTARALWRPGRTYPADPLLAVRRERAIRWKRRLLVSSAVVWAIAFFSAPARSSSGRPGRVA